jgi:hypothetical protein
VHTVSEGILKRNRTLFRVFRTAIGNLRQLLQNDFVEYPYLSSLLRELCDLKQFSDDMRKQVLEVKIISFAYKKGIPNDPSGNGGGFVFDCRAINNPGKYERYNHFNGLDEPVIDFLEKDGEITQFLESVYAIVDATVKRYLNRGFTNLRICFGCREEDIDRFIPPNIWQNII